MGTVLITGITAAFAPAYIYTVSIYSVAISTIINIIQAIARNINYTLPFKNEADKSIESQKHIRVFIRQEHWFFKNKLASLVEKLANEYGLEDYTNKFPKIFNKKPHHYKSIAAIRDELGKNTVIKDAYSKHINYSKSRFKKLFTASTIRDMVTHVTTVFFIMWLISSTFSGLSYFPSIKLVMSNLAHIFADPYTGYKFGIFAIVLTGISGGLDYVINKLHYEFKVRLTGAAYYKPEKDADIDNHASKQMAYNILHLRTQQLNEKLEQAKKAIREERARRKRENIFVSAAVLEAEDFILSMKMIDVLNDYFFENMLEEPSTRAHIKEGVFHIASFYSGFQPWAFNVKNLALSGGPFATIVASVGIMLFGVTHGPLIAFLSVMVFFGIVGGTNNLTDYQMKNEHHHKVEFLNKLDTRLRHSNNNYEKLHYANKLYKLLRDNTYNKTEDKKEMVVRKDRVTPTDNHHINKLFKPSPRMQKSQGNPILNTKPSRMRSSRAH